MFEIVKLTNLINQDCRISENKQPILIVQPLNLHNFTSGFLFQN